MNESGTLTLQRHSVASSPASSKQDGRLITDRDRRRLGQLLACGQTAAMGSSSARFELEVLLEQATTIPAEQTPADLVTMNSIVVLVDARTKESKPYTVIYPEDYEIPDSVHVLQPLGQSVLGRRQGEFVEVQATGERYRISSLLYQPEAAGNAAL